MQESVIWLKSIIARIKDRNGATREDHKNFHSEQSVGFFSPSMMNVSNKNFNLDG